jgi:hypothetical protein
MPLDRLPELVERRRVEPGPRLLRIGGERVDVELHHPRQVG